MSAPDAAAPGAPGAPGADGAPGGAPPAPPNTSSNRRLQQTQAQVEEVVDIMRVNVDKVLERDQKLSELDDRADALQAGASQFESCAAKLKNKYWWKNCKMMIMMGIIGVIMLGIIFCPPISRLTRLHSENDETNERSFVISTFVGDWKDSNALVTFNLGLIGNSGGSISTSSVMRTFVL
ncbi:synaptobrevin isoform X1 [Syngnathoides biaculeatus]|uniref:synaptobrevin isoform X1 n=1 Tax=Syngnathoides biaculeatus TaxID=300417 RepID=UPI002ADDD5F9|nr:synaptobrevin isoform X1 [Syngnathoides biaculeatus]